MKTPVWLAVKYAKMYMQKMEGFSVKNYSPFLANSRCVHCGDSQKSKSKKRLFCFEKSGNVSLYCHNCGHSSSLEFELKQFDEFLYRQMLAEKFAEENNTKPLQEPVKKQKVCKNDGWRSCLVPAAISTRARSFLESRKIPKQKFDLLFYTENLKHTYVDICSSLNMEPDPTKKIPEFECIFIPFLDKEGNLTFSTSRNMDNTNSMRYVTLEFQPSYKIFGIDRVNESDMINVFEGPIDSLFLDNSVAVGDASLDRASQVLPKDKLRLIPDNEPRAPVQNKRILGFIEKGFNVVLWPEYIKEKDVNDMVKSGINVSEVVELNTYRGLSAKLRFKEWSKT